MRKKYLLVLCAGLLLASTAALTSCDKGSDEPVPGLEWQEGGYQYVEPCLQWGASTSQVKNWMESNTKEFKLMSDIPDGMLMYNRNSPSTQLQYIFGIGHPGLMDVTITYNSIEGFQDVKSKTEKSYNCKLLQNPENPEHYEAEGVIINGKKTCIDIIVKKIPQFPTSGIVTIKYSLED